MWGAGHLNKFMFLEWTPEVEGTTPKPAYTSRVRLPRPTRTWWLFSLKPVPILHLHLLHQPRPSALLSGGTEPGSSSLPPLRARAPCWPRSFLRACTPTRSWPSRRQPEPHWTRSEQTALPPPPHLLRMCLKVPAACPSPSQAPALRPPPPDPSGLPGHAGQAPGSQRAMLAPSCPGAPCPRRSVLRASRKQQRPPQLPPHRLCDLSAGQDLTRWPGCWGAGPARRGRAGLQGSAGSGLRFWSWPWCSPPLSPGGGPVLLVVGWAPRPPSPGSSCPEKRETVSACPCPPS